MDIKKSRKLAIVIIIVTIFLALTAGTIAWYYYSINDFTPGDSNANLDETTCNTIELYDSTDLLTPIPAFRGDVFLDSNNSYRLVAKISEPEDINSDQSSNNKINYLTLIVNGEQKEFSIQDADVVTEITPGEYTLTFTNIDIPEDSNQVSYILIGHNRSGNTQSPLFTCDTLTFAIDTGDNQSPTTGGDDGATSGSDTTGGSTGDDGIVPEPTDYFACSVDSDCVKVTNTCCGCEAGGTEIAVNSKYQDPASRGLTCSGDEICSQVYLCTDRQPYCNSGSCSLRDPVIIEPGDDGTNTTTGNTETTTGTSTSGEDGAKAAIAVTKEGTMCVERTAPNNIATFTVRVTNTSTVANTITKIVDSLPLGFTYVAGSAKLNSTTIEDAIYLTINSAGNSQELVWENSNGWEINQGGSQVLTFNATAGANALTGKVMNEVVITPSVTPSDLSTLRTSFDFTVAQNCTTPETGILDSSLGKIILGIIIIVGAFTFYRSKRSLELSENLASMEVGENVKSSVKLGVLKATEPRKYFEEKIKRRIDK